MQAASKTFKVAIELEGIPLHAWAEDTAAKILGPSCWIHAIDQNTTTKADLSAFKLTAWTSDPRSIPKVVWLHMTENEVVHVSANPIFGNLPPYIRRKGVLRYRVLVHLKHVTDFDPEDPTPPPSPPGSNDGDSGHDGNLERHHFTGGAIHRIQGFHTARGVVDGEPVVNNQPGPSCRWAERPLTSFAVSPSATTEHLPPVENSLDDGMIEIHCINALEDDLFSSISRSVPMPAPVQPASDPMVLEARLQGRASALSASEPNNAVEATQDLKQVNCGSLSNDDSTLVCAVESVSPASTPATAHAGGGEDLALILSPERRAFRSQMPLPNFNMSPPAAGPRRCILRRLSHHLLEGRSSSPISQGLSSITPKSGPAGHRPLRPR